MVSVREFFVLFFFNDTATTEIYTLSLHDALPISLKAVSTGDPDGGGSLNDQTGTVTSNVSAGSSQAETLLVDRKSTRLNSSHTVISYAVFCLKKKNNNARRPYRHGACIN